MEQDQIDFVITWVDGNDEKWQEEKAKYADTKISDANSNIRYRDWGFLKYWFRAVEKNAPWVNKIYLITCGQTPKWLNIDNEKIILVNHTDYIPNEYLPTFNSNVIELFMNRIEGLAEKFVYFNDDVLILNKVDKADFFEDNMVKDQLIFNAVSVQGKNTIIGHTILNDLELIAKYYTKKQVEKNNKGKIYTLKYGKKAIKSFLLKPWQYFTGIENLHTAMPYIKSTWNDVWEKEYKEFNNMAKNRFRTKYDYNHWIFKYWQMFSGNFIPTSNKENIYYDLKNDNTQFINNVKNGKYKIACINDSNENLQFEKVKKEMIDMFEYLYPKKSSFEK